jgi:hypothetical protein
MCTFKAIDDCTTPDEGCNSRFKLSLESILDALLCWQGGGGAKPR